MGQCRFNVTMLSINRVRSLRCYIIWILVEVCLMIMKYLIAASFHLSWWNEFLLGSILWNAWISHCHIILFPFDEIHIICFMLCKGRSFQICSKFRKPIFVICLKAMVVEASELGGQALLSFRLVWDLFDTHFNGMLFNF